MYEFRGVNGMFHNRHAFVLLHCFFVNLYLVIGFFHMNSMFNKDGWYLVFIVKSIKETPMLKVLFNTLVNP